MLETLKNSKMFEGIDESILKKISVFSKLEKIKANETVLEEDSSDNCDLFIVVAGRVKIFVSSRYFSKENDDSKSIYTVNPGDFFGEMSSIVNKRRSASAVTMTDCELVRINGKKFIQLLENDHKAGFLILRNLYETLYDRIQNSNFMLRNLLI
ncbi:MAG TPA: cyclic nucleotide-binding domain-containing protein [Clostridiales bacterium]|jgi:CRP-like cAMP-binding protein|nr:cyclic nucleotide-binding domain-containing protein [Clostridiales bacterium]HQP70757.1 cyclic nucleotide-binding domain-containing protein [Clostridiales bacterium]